MPSRTKKRPSRKPSTGPKPEPKSYQIVVRWSEEDACFLARVPALQGCVTHADTPEDALARGLDAAALWIDDASQHGDRIPPPRPSAPGKMTLRLPPSLHQRVGEAAERDRVSINQWIVLRIADAV